MHPQEKETLNNLLDQLSAARVELKDAEADALIQEACARQPNASYLLVQRMLLLEKALQDAQARIGQLQEELSQAQPASRRGFLDANCWGQPTPGKPNQPAPVAASTSASSSSPSWGSGFLGNMATTAAGVVAGSFLFRGIEHLMGDHGSGWLSSGGVSSYSPAAETTVINNYFEDVPNTDLDAASLMDGSDSTEATNWI
jgi:uncharacterized protein